MVDFATAQQILNQRGSVIDATLWQRHNSTFRATMPIYWEDSSLPACQLQMVHRPQAPWAPTVLILCEGVCLWRIDFNGQHRRERGTHMQTDTRPDCMKWLRDLPAAAPLDDSCDIEPMFHTGAKELGIDTTSVDWFDPPRGGSHDRH